MKTYLPRFTLRRALIAITLLALFLGWLRPHRAELYNIPDTSGIAFGPARCGVVLYPMWPDCEIEFTRTESVEGNAIYEATTEFKASVADKKLQGRGVIRGARMSNASP